MWWRRAGTVALLTAALVGSVLTVGAPVAGAQQTDKQRELGERHTELSRAAEDAARTVTDARARKAELESTIGDLQSRVVAAQAALAAAQAEVERLAAVASLLGAQVEDTQLKLDDAMDDAKTSAVLLYTRPPSTGVADLIGSTDGAGSLIEGKHYLERVAAKRRHDVARAERLRKELEAQKAELVKQEQQANGVREQAEAAAREVESLYARQQSARDEAARQESIAGAAQATYTAEAFQVAAALEQENERVRAMLAAAANDGPPMGNGTFLRPVGNAPITSGFGYRTDPISGAQAFHSGIDFGASCGTPIKAAGNGTVFVAGSQGGYGNAVILNHGGGLATLYGHQSAIAVGVGQTVAAGQVIGYVGSTGKSTGCHLHFEVRVNGNAVNPAGYL